MPHNTDLEIVDSHQHFWQYSPHSFPWISQDMVVLQRDFMPGDLWPEMRSSGVTATVAVQARQSEEETLFLLNLADKYDFIGGVVGWIDLQSPRLSQRLRYFSKFPKLKGFRHIVQDEPNERFLLERSFTQGLSQLRDHGFTYDILIYPRHLQWALQLAKMLPGQKFVIDHMAKPLIRERSYHDWARLMRQIGRLPNVWCKISGLITEAHWDRWSYTDLQKYLSLVFESFDNDRIMFGSDWPVCLLAGSYQQVKDIVALHTKPLEHSIKQKIWSRNAREFYGL